MIGAALGMLTGGGGLSASSSATSSAEGGVMTTNAGMGDFSFKTASGASTAGDGSNSTLIIAVVAIGAALLLWNGRRK